MPELTHADLFANSRFLDLYMELKAKKTLKKKRELTDSVGMPQEYFSRIENNTITIPSHFLDKLIDLYQLSDDYFTMPESKGTSNYNQNTAHGGRATNKVNQQPGNDPFLQHLKQEVIFYQKQLEKCQEDLRIANQTIIQLSQSR